MQILEGPDEAIDTLYEKIKKDQRHKDATLISRETITERKFTKWEMAFLNLDDPALKEVPGYSQFLRDELVANVYREKPHRASVMMLTFRDSMR